MPRVERLILGSQEESKCQDETFLRTWEQPLTRKRSLPGHFIAISIRHLAERPSLLRGHLPRSTTVPGRLGEIIK